MMSITSIHFTLFAKASETKTESQKNGKIVRQKDRMIKRQKYKKGQKDRINRIQNANTQFTNLKAH